MLIRKLQPVSNLLHCHPRVSQKQAGRVYFPGQHIFIGCLAICLPENPCQLGRGKAGFLCQLFNTQAFINMLIHIFPHCNRSLREPYFRLRPRRCVSGQLQKDFMEKEGGPAGHLGPAALLFFTDMKELPE